MVCNVQGCHAVLDAISDTWHQRTEEQLRSVLKAMWEGVVGEEQMPLAQQDELIRRVAVVVSNAYAPYERGTMRGVRRTGPGLSDDDAVGGDENKGCRGAIAAPSAVVTTIEVVNSPTRC